MKSRLKEIRERKGISQADLSQILNVTPSAVGMWEQGRREPSYEKLKRISDVFNVSTDYLLGRENITTPSQDEMNLLEDFRNLTQDGRNIILGVLNSLKVTHSAAR